MKWVEFVKYEDFVFKKKRWVRGKVGGGYKLRRVNFREDLVEI